MRWGTKMKQYIVDAFTDTPFKGNPAAVCVMESWPSETFMKNLAMENNLSETAFIVKEEKGYHLRWFTPSVEVELCGHATLASAFVILNFYDSNQDVVSFHTLSGELTVTKKQDLYEMDFPGFELREIEASDQMEQVFGVRPIKALLGLDLICIFDSEEDIQNMNPDSNELKKLEGRIQNVSAKGEQVDCVSRSFCPKLGIYEDPVCGSAHVQIATYWANELKKKDIVAFQASKRSGTLYCKVLENGRVSLSGKAVLVMESEVKVEE